MFIEGGRPEKWRQESPAAVARVRKTRDLSGRGPFRDKKLREYRAYARALVTATIKAFTFRGFSK